MPEAAAIRPLVKADLRMLLEWRNHPSIREVMLTSQEIGKAEHSAWFDRVSHDSSRRLLVVETGAGPFGFVQFSHVAPGGVSDWGFYTRPDAPKGSGQLLGLTALDHAFFELQLHKVCGQVIARNDASNRFHRRVGFRKEGYLRDQHRSDGHYESLVCFGLLETEWPQARADIVSSLTWSNQGDQP